MSAEIQATTSKNSAFKIAVIGTGFRPSGLSTPPDEINGLVSPDCTATLIETESTEFPSTPEIRARVTQAYVQTGLQAAAAGYDAIYINTVGDYGLEALRQQLDIPIIGSGETAVMVAALLTGTFSFVTIWPPSMAFIYEDLLSRTGKQRDCQSIEHLSTDDNLNELAKDNNFVTELRQCSLSSIEKFKTAIAATSEKYRGSIISGCTCMAPAALQLLGNHKNPIIEPMTLGYCFTEHWLRTSQLTQPPFEAFARTQKL